MTFPGLTVDVIDQRIREMVPKMDLNMTRGGTVAEVTPASNRAQVQMDGSNLAVPVKVFGDVSCAPGDRVGLLRIGTEWTVIGTYTRRRSITMPDGATTGTQRMVFGADTPPELAAYGLVVALLAYVTDASTGLERGYFFIGLSNSMDVGNIRALVFGNVTYPTPGNPATATVADVKTNFQMQQYAQQARTVFKDSDIWLYNAIKLFVGNEVDNVVRILTQGTLNEEAISKTAAADTTTSATSVPFSETSMNFQKRYAGTELVLEIDLSMWSTVGSTATVVGINVNGVDHDLSQFFHNLASVHMTVPKGFKYVSGIPAGNYTPYGYWRRLSGTGTLTRDNQDHYLIRVYEVVR